MSERGLEGDLAGSIRAGEPNAELPEGPASAEAAGSGPGRAESGTGSEAILSAVGFAASAFLQARSWEERIPEVLARLGRAAAVSRVYLFENHADEQGRRVHSQRFEWTAENVKPQIDNPDLQNSPWSGTYARWADILAAGKVIHGHVRDFPEEERRSLEREEILSMAVVPVLVGEEWWGYLGFDECLNERAWARPDIDALRAAAGTLGACIARKRTELALGEAELKYRTLVEQIPAIVYIAGVGETGDWLYISPQVHNILGYTPEEWMAHPSPFSAFLHPVDRERVLAEEAFSSVTGEPLRSEFRLISRDDRTIWIRDEAMLIQDEDGRPMFWQGVMYDVTDQKRAEEQVAFLAYHDKLTALPNRVMFEELLDLAMTRSRRSETAVGVLYVDLDNFKLVNDSLGHAAGDQLLQMMGMRLREAVRETDVVARQGGDEFLVLLSDVERGNWGPRPEAENSVVVAQAVAGRIHDALRVPFVIGDTEFFISASIGISLFPFDGDNGKSLLRNSDAAMYRSKRVGPGGYAMFSSDAVDPLTKLSLTTRLRRAVERKEWLLHFQPVVDLGDAHLVGVEALLRWPDPKGGMTPPAEFIPLAEEMGLIEAIGDWVLGDVCRQSKEWRSSGLMLEISFNLSPRQLWQSNLVRSILGQLQYAQVSPRNIVVEITESSAMTDPDRTIRVLDELHAAGLRLAIDDFGTGYSSLSRLKQMPVDILKIDRSFVNDVPGDRHVASMVKAIIQMAHGLGMTPLAEGIETEEQWKFLAENGCSLGQGYYFSKPVTAEEITQRYVWGNVPQAT
jgi:diguanylate cyclase (GGDEF)-like protein/PAS domain S-box-containing protein